jgi:hypothetical protein
MEKAMWVRILASIAVLVSAVIHLELWLTVFRDTAIVGPAMLVNFGGGIVIAVLLIVWRHWLPFLLAVLFGAATLGAFITSTTAVGLFGVHQTRSGWDVFTAAAGRSSPF